MSRPNKIQVWQVWLLNLMISVKMSARIIFHCKHVPVRKNSSFYKKVQNSLNGWQGAPKMISREKHDG